MPAYDTLTLPPALYQYDGYKVWNAENPASLTASERIAVTPSQDGAPAFYSIDLVFSANPGSFEVDIQEATDDVDADYIMPSTFPAITTASLQSDGTYRARVDLNSPVTARFLRAYMKTAPTYSGGAPTVSLKIVRQ